MGGGTAATPPLVFSLPLFPLPLFFLSLSPSIPPPHLVHVGLQLQILQPLLHEGHQGAGGHVRGGGATAVDKGLVPKGEGGVGKAWEERETKIRRGWWRGGGGLPSLPPRLRAALPQAAWCFGAATPPRGVLTAGLAIGGGAGACPRARRAAGRPACPGRRRRFFFAAPPSPSSAGAGAGVCVCACVCPWRARTNPART